MKELRVVEKVLLKARIGVSKHLVVFLNFLTAICGIHTQVIAQVSKKKIPERPDFTNQAITTDCCPMRKGIVDSVINNAPFVFEGRMIKYDPSSLSHLFEIEKVYRGGERLQAGTVEVVVKMSHPIEPLTRFFNGWHIIFAKEINDLGSFEANNAIKLELYNDYAEDPSLLQEWAGYYSGLLDFQTKEGARDFLFTYYNLSPTDIPKADTLMTLSGSDIREAKKKAEENAKARTNEITPKQHYQYLLENKWRLDSLSGKKTSRKSIDDAMREYENSSDSMRYILRFKLIMDEFKPLDTDTNARKSQGQLRGDDDITLITSIQNIDITEDTAKYLEFDIMVRADTIGSYPYAIYLCLLYESDNLDQPFKHI